MVGMVKETEITKTHQADLTLTSVSAGFGDKFVLFLLCSPVPLRLPLTLNLKRIKDMLDRAIYLTMSEIKQRVGFPALPG